MKEGRREEEGEKRVMRMRRNRRRGHYDNNNDDINKKFIGKARMEWEKTEGKKMRSKR